MQKSIHFIAIGGSAMHNLAIAMKRAGYQVTGSDDQIFEPSKTRLAKEGLLPEKEGWFPEKLNANTDVILGMHAKADNPELKKAQELGLSISSYPEYLAKCMASNKRVVIAGSHGKTTITSMLLHILAKNNIDTAYMVGAQLKGFDCMVNLESESNWAVIEGDEYLSSPLDLNSKFLWYKPELAIITGIAWDHFNVFKTEADYIKCFTRFVMSMQQNATLIYFNEDYKILPAIKAANRPDINLIPYSYPSYTVNSGQYEVAVDGANEKMEVIGKHNMANLQGALLLANEMGVEAKDALTALKSFSGADKRLQKIEVTGFEKAYLDFAHAPSKVKATVAGIRESYPNHKIKVLLELHTYSSLNKDFIPNYKNTLDPADEVKVYYDKRAMEIKRMPELNPKEVEQAFAHGNMQAINKKEDLSSVLNELEEDNTVLLLLSSGNFGGMLHFKKL